MWLHCNYMKKFGKNAKHRSVRNSMKPMKIEIEGYEALEKIPSAGGNSARIYVPKEWTGKRVKIVLLEGDEDDK